MGNAFDGNRDATMVLVSKIAKKMAATVPPADVRTHAPPAQQKSATAIGRSEFFERNPDLGWFVNDRLAASAPLNSRAAADRSR